MPTANTSRALCPDVSVRTGVTKGLRGSADEITRSNQPATVSSVHRYFMPVRESQSGAEAPLMLADVSCLGREIPGRSRMYGLRALRIRALQRR